MKHTPVTKWTRLRIEEPRSLESEAKDLASVETKCKAKDIDLDLVKDDLLCTGWNRQSV
jgi:hypothetical protein